MIPKLPPLSQEARNIRNPWPNTVPILGGQAGSWTSLAGLIGTMFSYGCLSKAVLETPLVGVLDKEAWPFRGWLRFRVSFVRI